MQNSNTSSLVNRQIALILFGFILVMSIVGVASKVGISSLSTNNQRFEKTVHRNNEQYKQLVVMSDAIRDRMLIVYDIVHSNDIFEIDELAAKSNEKVRVFLAARDKLSKLGLTDEQMQQLDEQRKLLVKAQTILNSIIEQSLNEQALDSLSNIQDARQANTVVLQSLLDMQNYQNSQAKQELENAKELTRESGDSIFLLAIAAVLLSAIVVGIIIRHMRTQGQALDTALRQLEDNNQQLEARVKTRTEELLTMKADNMRMTAELDVGRQIQSIILPTAQELCNEPSLDIAAFMEPADEVGGDYYDVLKHDNGTYICIGDVTGHGLESGVLMLMTQSSVRSQLEHSSKDITTILSRVNETLYKNLQRMKSDKHLTLSLLNYKQANGHAELQLCGQHESMIIVRSNGSIEEIDTDALGFPAGLVESIEEYVAKTTVPLMKDDVAVLYTDGITEAADMKHNLYGIERLKNVISTNRQASAEHIKNNIIESVKQHIDKQTVFDDLTLVVLKQVA